MHVATMGERRGLYMVLVGKLEIKRALRRPRKNGRIKLRWISRKGDGVYGLDRAGSG